MTLTDQDYEQLKPHLRQIDISARTNTQSNPSAWYVMDEIKRKYTGISSDGFCSGCVFELYREFVQLIAEYENNHK